MLGRIGITALGADLEVPQQRGARSLELGHWTQNTTAAGASNAAPPLLSCAFDMRPLQSANRNAQERSLERGRLARGLDVLCCTWEEAVERHARRHLSGP